MNLEKKYFKCYLCQTRNYFTVPKTEKGKECRCCLAYNYFFKNNHKKFKRNNYYYNKNKKRHYNRNNNNNRYNNNNNYNYNYAPNTAFSITNNNTNTANSHIQQNNNFSSLINFLNNNINRNTINLRPSSLTINNSLYIPLNNKKEKKNSSIKYPWLKKEKLTEELNKKKEEYECSICLENIKVNEDINILKCGHIFHYNCIIELVEHKNNKCPNCRSDLKTGQKQKETQNTHLNSFSEFFIEDEEIFNEEFDDELGSMYHFEEDDFDDSFEEYF